MSTPAIRLFTAGPFPVLQSARVDHAEREVDLDVALLIEGQPNILASTTFPLDDTWERIESALTSGDAKLGVAGLPHTSQSISGQDEVFPSAYVSLECANGERLVLAHIRSLESGQESSAYARDVLKAIVAGATPEDLGETVDDASDE